jgi:hypothetical protein
VRDSGRAIVLEDDLVLSPGFLDYMNAALDMYADDSKVMHVSGYMFPVQRRLPETFFFNSTSCWGWATWKRAWEHYEPRADVLLKEIERRGKEQEFNIEGTHNFMKQLRDNVSGALSTWAVRWYASTFLQRGLCLHPGRSLVRNAGHDGSGEHCAFDATYQHQAIAERVRVRRIPLREHLRARAAAGDYFARQFGGSIDFRTRVRRRLSLAARRLRT